MRLSDIRGERTIEVIADLIDPICNIAERESCRGLLKKEKLPEGTTAEEAKAHIVARFRKFTPTLLRESKDDVISILSTIAGKTREEYTASMNLASLIVDLNELNNDTAFIELFMQAQSTEEPSGAAPENTEAP